MRVANNNSRSGLASVTMQWLLGKVKRYTV